MRRIVSSMNVRFENDLWGEHGGCHASRDLTCIAVRRKCAIMRKMTEYNECRRIAVSAKLEKLTRCQNCSHSVNSIVITCSLLARDNVLTTNTLHDDEFFEININCLFLLELCLYVTL